MRQDDEDLGPWGLEDWLLKDQARSKRRAHRERLKRARRWRWGRDDLSLHPLWWAQAVTTPAACSCPMCGNPRKWFGEQTVPERRFWQGWKEADQE